MRFSMRLRTLYNIRSNTGASSSDMPLTNICLMSGSTSRAAAPSTSGHVGTVRRCISCSPSRSISSIITDRIACCACSSFGRNTSPVPYFPFSGTGMPCSSMNSWGICSMMPAPSPVLSRVSAPRCSMFSSTFRALSTKSWLLPPCMFTTMPTPQASCSYCGWYSPSNLLFVIHSLLNLNFYLDFGCKGNAKR